MGIKTRVLSSHAFKYAHASSDVKLAGWHCSSCKVPCDMFGGSGDLRINYANNPYIP